MGAALPSLGEMGRERAAAGHVRADGAGMGVCFLRLGALVRLGLGSQQENPPPPQFLGSYVGTYPHAKIMMFEDAQNNVRFFTFLQRVCSFNRTLIRLSAGSNRQSRFRFQAAATGSLSLQEQAKAKHSPVMFGLGAVL